jgi:hypothetical protein
VVKKLRGMGEVLSRAAAELIADDGFVLAASIARPGLLGPSHTSRAGFGVG